MSSTTLTIAKLREQQDEYEGRKMTKYVITTSTGKTCYATKGIWNKLWKEGETVKAVIQPAKNGKNYYILKCPPELMPERPGATVHETGAMKSILELSVRVAALEKEIAAMKLASIKKEEPTPMYTPETTEIPSPFAAEEIPLQFYKEKDSEPFEDDLPF